MGVKSTFLKEKEMEEKTIVTSRVGDCHWSARLVGVPATEVGTTEDEAIGNLIRSWQELFNIRIFKQ